MNKDTNLIFEAYKQHRLVNEMDIGVENLGAFKGALKKGVGERAKSNDTYIFKKIADALKISPEEAAEMLAEPLYTAVFTDGKFAAKGSDKDQLDKLQITVQNKLSDVIDQIPALKDVKGIQAGAIKGYTSRIVKNFIATVATITDGASSKEDVKDAAELAVAGAPEEEIKKQVTGDKAQEQTSDEPEAEGSDRVTVRIEKLIADLVDDSGVNEAGVIKDVAQQILDSGGLGLPENRINGKVKSVLNNLIRKQVLERKGQFVKLGKNYEKFEQGGSDSSVLSDEDLISKTTGFGERPTTARSTWGGHGDSMFG